MIKLERTSVMNLENAMRGARNPMNSWDRMDSFYDEDGNYVLGPNDLGLAKRLRRAGSDHRKYIRQVFVSVDITAPMYWWKEYDTYKVATVANSTSTMHKIHSKPFELDDFSHDHMTPDTLAYMQTVVDRLEQIRLKYMNEGKNKEDWYDMIQLLPSSYNQMRTCTLNYETLINIYFSRKNHKLDEWREVCKWVESLPYSELITGISIGSDQSIEEKRFTRPFPWIKDDDVYCNNCEHFHDCLNKGGLADVTTSDDIVKNGFGRQHYINKPGYDCPKEKEQ